MDSIIKFDALYKLNVNGKVEKKNQLSYLSWAWAWAEFVKFYPDAQYQVVKNENSMPYFKDESGAFCYTRVTAGGITHEMWLPVMDHRNQTIKNPTAFDINKTIMRCLTKNLAMFGLGLYIYAGEDLPEDEPTSNKQEKKPAPNNKHHKNVLKFIVRNADNTTQEKTFGEITDATSYVVQQIESVHNENEWNTLKAWIKINKEQLKYLKEKGGKGYESAVITKYMHLSRQFDSKNE